MFDSRRIFRNSIFMGGSTLIGGALLLLVFVLIARYLGVSAFGEFTVVFSIAAILQLLVDGGLVTVMIRDVSREKSNTSDIVGVTKSLLWLISLIIYVLLFLIVETIQPQPQVKIAIYLLVLSSLINIHALVYGGVLRAYEDMDVVAAAAISHKVILLVFVIASVGADSGIGGVCSAFVASNLLLLLFYRLFVTNRYTKISLKFDWHKWQVLLKDSLPLGIGLTLRRITVHIDTFLLTLLSTTLAVGLFNSAYRAIQMIEVAAVVLCGVLLPALSRLGRQSSREQFNSLFGESVRILVILSMPLGVWFFVFSDQLIVMIYGSEYREAGLVLKCLGLSLPVLIPGALFFSTFSSLNQQQLYMAVTVIGVMTNVVLDIMLIPKYAYTGAAIATMTTEFIVFIAGVWVLWASGVRADYLKVYARSVVSVAVASIALLYVAKDGTYLSLLIASSVFMVIYLGMILAVGLVNMREVVMLRDLVRGSAAS